MKFNKQKYFGNKMKLDIEIILNKKIRFLKEIFFNKIMKKKVSLNCIVNKKFLSSFFIYFFNFQKN